MRLILAQIMLPVCVHMFMVSFPWSTLSLLYSSLTRLIQPVVTRIFHIGVSMFCVSIIQVVSGTTMVTSSRASGSGLPIRVRLGVISGRRRLGIPVLSRLFGPHVLSQSWHDDFQDVGVVTVLCWSPTSGQRSMTRIFSCSSSCPPKQLAPFTIGPLDYMVFLFMGHCINLDQKCMALTEQD